MKLAAIPRACSKLWSKHYCIFLRKLVCFIKTFQLRRSTVKFIVQISTGRLEGVHFRIQDFNSLHSPVVEGLAFLEHKPGTRQTVAASFISCEDRLERDLSRPAFFQLSAVASDAVSLHGKWAVAVAIDLVFGVSLSDMLMTRKGIQKGLSIFC